MINSKRILGGLGLPVLIFFIMEKLSDKQAYNIIEDLVIGANRLSMKYGPRNMAEALRGLADSFEEEYERSFDLTKSDFGFNEEHWFI